jgi:hypothetical protein
LPTAQFGVGPPLQTGGPQSNQEISDFNRETIEEQIVIGEKSFELSVQPPHARQPLIDKNRRIRRQQDFAFDMLT